MTVGIVGSRGINCYDFVCEKIPKNASKIVSGGALGVDLLAKRYATENSLDLLEITPDYKKYGKKAPLVRNLEIVSNCDYVLVFWDGYSNGSKNVINHCLENNIPVRVYVFKEDDK